ncbi:MAG: hypothetical protein ACP5T6_03775, partial [Candidatus Micrarchaeia archaeon]
KNKGRYATNEFIDSFDLDLINVNDKDTNFKAYSYLMKKYKELGEKFNNIAESAGDIIKSYIILFKIYNSEKDFNNTYNELDYLIKKCNKNDLKKFSRNLIAVYRNRSQISEILNYLKKEYNDINISNKIELFNQMGSLFALAEEDKIDNSKIDEIIKKFDSTIEVSEVLITEKLIDMLRPLRKYAPNTAKYIKKHINSKTSIFNKKSNNEKLYKLISEYIKIQKEIDKINLKISIDAFILQKLNDLLKNKILIFDNIENMDKEGLSIFFNLSMNYLRSEKNGKIICIYNDLGIKKELK